MYFPTSNERIFEKPSDDQMLTVVGVIKDMRLTGVVDPAGFQGSGTYYFPFRQNSVRQFGFAIRSSADPSAVIGTVRRELASIDPELPFYSVRTMEERTNQALLDRRTPTILAGGFALVALLLAAIGIYGVLSYQVSQRRREIGIRMALGAGASTIFGLVLREGAVIVMAGGAIGLAGAFFLRRVLASQLYGVDAMDPIVVATVGAVLGVVALAACLLPARRAAKTDPVVALAE
jgi:ABC-type antimicrobial peptide transport system permease subunit